MLLFLLLLLLLQRWRWQRLRPLLSGAGGPRLLLIVKVEQDAAAAVSCHGAPRDSRH